MSNLTKYNQRLLAIIGTSILTVGFISLLIATYSFIEPLFKNDEVIEEGVDVISNSDSTESLQTLSIEKLVPLDTSKSNYVLPVGQVRTHEVLGMSIINMDNYKSKSFEFRNYKSDIYNNFIYIDYEKDIKKIIFDKKLGILHWSYFRDSVSELLLFKVLNDDTNNDGTLNSKDKSFLYVFDTDSHNLVSFNLGDKRISEFFPIKGTTIIGIATSENIKNARNKSIGDVIGLDTENLKIVPIISQSMRDELQDILDEKISLDYKN